MRLEAVTCHSPGWWAVGGHHPGLTLSLPPSSWSTDVEQGQANCGLSARFHPTPVSVNRVLLEHSYALWFAYVCGCFGVTPAEWAHYDRNLWPAGHSLAPSEEMCCPLVQRAPYGCENQGHTLRTTEQVGSFIKPLGPSGTPHLEPTWCVTRTSHVQVTVGRFSLILSSTENLSIGWGSKVQITVVFKEKWDLLKHVGWLKGLWQG